MEGGQGKGQEERKCEEGEREGKDGRGKVPPTSDPFCRLSQGLTFACPALCFLGQLFSHTRAPPWRRTDNKSFITLFAYSYF